MFLVLSLIAKYFDLMQEKAKSQFRKLGIYKYMLYTHDIILNTVFYCSVIVRLSACGLPLSN